MKCLNEYLNNQLSLIDFLFEGQIGGLKDVKTIRHYTTGEGMLSILNNGFIEARESTGDEDWKDYNIGDKKVVSFHDARTDPEWESVLKRNANDESIYGYTFTLGVNAKKICGCIEIDYDKLDDLIKDKTKLLNIFEKKTDDFINVWNNVVANKEHSIKIYKAKLAAAEYLSKKFEEKDEYTINTIKDFIDKRVYYYSFTREYKDEKIVKDLIEIFHKFLSNEELNENAVLNVGTPLYASLLDDTMINSVKEIDTSQPRYITEFKPKNINKYINKCKNCITFLKRTNFTKFSKEEKEELNEIVLTFDFVKAIKLLRKHGWNRSYTKDLSEFYKTPYYGVDEDGNPIDYDWTLYKWLNQIMNNKERIIKDGIEIRISSNVNINKDNCKIIIFDGLCNATKQKKLKKLPKKYYTQYNIEHIKGKGED